MRKYLIGFIVGIVIGGGVVFAADRRVSLQSGSGVELGTASNPLYITN